MEVLLTVALQGALIGTLIIGTERLPGGEWNDKPLALVQSKALQGFLAPCIVFHHCAQKVFYDRWGSGFSLSGLEVMALMGFAFVGYFFFCSGYGLYQSCQRKQDYLDGFLRRRVVPLLLIYFACNTIYLVGRLAVGETFDASRLACLLCGIELANPNAWFVVTLPIVYLLFYVSKRGSSDEALVTRRLFLGTGAYILVGTAVMMAFSNINRYGVFLGRWWYNTVIQKMILDARISKYKEQGKSLEELIAWYEETDKGHYDINPNGIWKWNDGYSPELMNDITEYLRQHW